MEVIDFFRLSETRAQKIKTEVLASVGNWGAIAKKAGLGRAERQAMEAAFNV